MKPAGVHHVAICVADAQKGLATRQRRWKARMDELNMRLRSRKGSSRT